MAETTVVQYVDEASDAVAWATAIVVDNPEAWRSARERRAGYKKLDNELESHFKSMKHPWDEGKKKILDLEEERRGPVVKAIDALDEKILAYEREFFREREIHQRSLNEQERAKAIGDRLAEAEDLKAAGEYDAADALFKQPLHVPAVILPEFDGWVEGESRQDYWSCDVYAFSELVLAVASGEQPLSLLLPNQTALNMMARAQHESMNIPGCRARSRKGIVQR